tara:strand:+ start:19 stop:336 length:318 start_codon:yes stop_codon:yes gene_type:complete
MFKYLFGNTTQLGEKEKKKKNTIGHKENFVIIRKEVVDEIPKFEEFEDIHQVEKLQRFLNETVENAQQEALDEWEGGKIDLNVMSKSEEKQQKFLNDLQEKINQL